MISTLRQTIVFFLVCACTVCFADERNAPQQSANELIEQLSSKSYLEREQSADALLRMGNKAIGALEKASRTTDAEVSWRVIDILEKIAVSSDMETLGRVQKLFVKLGSEGKKAMFDRANKLLARQKEHQSQIAIARIRELGGMVQEYGSGNNVVLGGGFGGPIVIDGAREIRLGGGRVRLVEVEEIVDELEIKVDEAEMEREMLKALEEIENLDIKKRKTERAKGESKKEESDNQSENQSDNQSDKQSEGDEQASVKPMDIEKSIVAAFNATRSVVPQSTSMLSRSGAAIFSAVTMLQEPIEVFEMGGRLGGLRPMGLVESVPVNPGAKSRMITIGKNWKGTDKDLQVIGMVNNLTSVTFKNRKLSSTAIQQIENFETTSISIDRCNFEAKDLFSLKKKRPKLSISIVGNAMLGLYPVQTGNTSGGCTISEIMPNSGAEKAGLKAGDRVIKVNEFEVNNFETLTFTVGGRKAGEKLKVHVIRGGETKEFEVTLGKRDD